jgi:galactose mutarotase-like enzyme
MASKRRPPIATLREPLGAGAKKRRSPRRVVLGCCDIAGRQADARDVGDALGRLVNGISDRKFTPDGETCPIATPKRGVPIRGGVKGFPHQIWTIDLFLSMIAQRSIMPSTTVTWRQA